MSLQDPPETGAHGADHATTMPDYDGIVWADEPCVWDDEPLERYACSLCDAPAPFAVSFCPDCGEAVSCYLIEED